MKKIVNKLKQNAKIITAFIFGAILTGGTVYAATTIASSQVGYNNSTSGLAATDVQGALDELNTKANTWIDPSEITATMQGFGKSALPNIGDTTFLKDARDGTLYRVRKLADGNVWMTENLRIAGKTIKSADSNITSIFPIPSSNLSNFQTSDRTVNATYIDSTYGGYYTFSTATAGWGGERTHLAPLQLTSVQKAGGFQLATNFKLFITTIALAPLCKVNLTLLFPATWAVAPCTLRARTATSGLLVHSVLTATTHTS